MLKNQIFYNMCRSCFEEKTQFIQIHPNKGKKNQNLTISSEIPTTRTTRSDLSKRKRKEKRQLVWLQQQNMRTPWLTSAQEHKINGSIHSCHFNDIFFCRSESLSYPWKWVPCLCPLPRFQPLQNPVGVVNDFVRILPRKPWEYQNQHQEDDERSTKRCQKRTEIHLLLLSPPPSPPS